MPRTTYTPSLPGLSAADDDLDTIINWGAGADSSAYIAKMLTAPDAHGIDLDRTAVLYMATGSEWPETRLLADIGKFGYQNLRNGRPLDVAKHHPGHHGTSGCVAHLAA
ncbi:hypothetical protein OHT57_46975 [Streptomyces sp. NBC_00285]|uniref:hypothetical protein n=1 Tax=Streptomyces sp. NBC_00285 TaxID=2975700 RepID=UPI002E2C4945|nr:hypothetical protein [Streptomyces sp. NBC_00285]